MTLTVVLKCVKRRYLLIRYLEDQTEANTFLKVGLINRIGMVWLLK